MLRCGLASDGVYICPSRYREGGSLLHCPSTLTDLTSAVHFCCTVLGVTSTGCYPAPCPVKPGLSSSGTFRPASRDHLSYLPLFNRKILSHYLLSVNPFLLIFKHLFSFHIRTLSSCLLYRSKIHLRRSLHCLLLRAMEAPDKTTASGTIYKSKQPPPINSRIRELFGMSSPGIGRK